MKPIKITHKTTFEFDDGFERDLICFVSYSPGRPGCSYMPNGDPGYPDEPDEMEITGLTDKDGNDIPLNDEEFARLSDKVEAEILELSDYYFQPPEQY